MKQDPNPGTGVVDGTVYGLFPESSRELYEKCIVGLARERNVKLSSTLDSKVRDIAEQVWRKIQTAEVVVADITGYDLQIICELGMARGLKESNKILLLRSKDVDEKEKSRFPLDLEGLEILPYDMINLMQIRQDLSERLNESLKNRAPVEPIEDLNVRQLVEKAIMNTQAKEYLVANALFLQAATGDFANNWYIHMRWGVMHREKGDFREARKCLLKAEEETGFDEQKAEVFIEQAILEFRDKEISMADRLFTRARSADKKNRRLYIIWADILYQLGRPEKALGRIIELIEAVGGDSETTRMMQFYTDMHSKQQRQAAELVADQGDANTKGSGMGTAPPIKSIPKTITWEDFKHEFVGYVVEGTVNNAHRAHGVFVLLGSFKGLISRKYLTDNFDERFYKGEKVKVKILDAYTRAKDGVDAIDLMPV